MKKIHVAYINHDQNYTEADIILWGELIKKNLPNVKYLYFPSIQSLFPKFTDPNFKVDYINLDIEFLENFSNGNPYSLIGTLRTLSENTMYKGTDGELKKRDVRIIGCVKYDSKVDTIKYILPLVDGLCISVSGKWSRELVLGDQKKLVSGDLSTPVEIKKLLKNKKEKTINLKDGIMLTPRQKQVFTLVTNRGSSNKVIAKALNISESTVKLHVGSILKKYGLKSRTQLVAFTK